MAVYDLERFVIFLVEDNIYIRNVLEDLLRRLKVGTVASATNGQEAIEYLKGLGKLGGQQGRHAIDIVISDLVMAPINGLLLLRWVRSAPESPNRFLPFVMLSGAADMDYVRASRDLGTNEFLGKPFSAYSVYRRLLSVIDFPRQIVATQAYFGPDRRRRSEPPPGNDRRLRKDSDVTIVYSAKKVVKPERASDVWYFRLPNRLKEKAGGLGASGHGDLPLDLLAEAEKELERVALDFTQWAGNYLKNLGELVQKAAADAGGRRKIYEEINLLAHELRGQGGTFGYPLITTFGKMLYEATRPGCREDANGVEIVKAHVDAMRAVIREKISGDGGDIGRELLASLKQAIDKHAQVA